MSRLAALVSYALSVIVSAAALWMPRGSDRLGIAICMSLLFFLVGRSCDGDNG